MTRLYRRPVPMMTAAVAMLLMVTACHMGAYDAGDSRHSYLRADFAEVHTNSNGALCRAVTDDGDSLVLAPVLKTSWATRPDTLYRALLYYNKGEADATQSQAASRALSVTGVGARQVYVLRPQAGSAGVSGPDDAVGFQSCWMSASKRYVNVGLVLKSGQADQPDAGPSHVFLPYLSSPKRRAGLLQHHCLCQHSDVRLPHRRHVAAYHPCPSGWCCGAQVCFLKDNFYFRFAT